jgi:hypothetical protein
MMPSIGVGARVCWKLMVSAARKQLEKEASENGRQCKYSSYRFGRIAGTQNTRRRKKG